MPRSVTDVRLARGRGEPGSALRPRGVGPIARGGAPPSGGPTAGPRQGAAEARQARRRWRQPRAARRCGGWYRTYRPCPTLSAMLRRGGRWLSGAAAPAVLFGVLAASASPADATGYGGIRLNQVQVVGSHNSYH